MFFSAFVHCALTVARSQLYLRSTLFVLRLADAFVELRKVMEHSCSTGPLQSPLCAFHIVQRSTHTHTLLYLAQSQSRLRT